LRILAFWDVTDCVSLGGFMGVSKLLVAFKAKGYQSMRMLTPPFETSVAAATAPL
jgi:hypothetical protein